MKKIIRIGRGQYGNVYGKIEFADGRLSITGVEGPMKNGDARGSCGQIVDTKIIELAPAWTQEMLDKFYAIWHEWHLNDMRAGCEHQRAEKWDERPIDSSKPLNAYGNHYEGQKQNSWNMLTWLNASEHPDGLMCKPCLVCGYKYGTAWLKEEVPQEVIDWLSGLPDSDATPAWV